MKRVCVIGAGPSGITAAKNCIEAGLDVVVFEKNDKVGGNWVFNAATIFWCQALSHPPGHTLPWSHWSRPHGPDERVQKITRNFLDKVLR